MTITSIVSHGPVALETGPVCYGGAEEDTASKAWMYSKQVYDLASGEIGNSVPFFHIARTEN